MITIHESMIKELADNDQVYQRGVKYFLTNRVVNFDFDMGELCATAEVLGSERYDVEVYFDGDGDVIGMDCDCQAFYQYDGACKHIVAVLLTCQRKLGGRAKKTGGTKNGSKKSPDSKPDYQLAEGILDYFDYRLNTVKKPLNLEVTFEVNEERNYYEKKMVKALSLRLGEDKLYVLKNVKNFLDAIANGQRLVFGQNFTFDVAIHKFKDEDKPMMDFIGELYDIENDINEEYGYFGRYGSQGHMLKGKHIRLTRATARRALSILESRGEFNLKIGDQDFKNIKMVHQDLPLNFGLDKQQNDLVLQWNAIAIFPLENSGKYLFHNGQVYCVSERQRASFIPIFNSHVEHPGGIRLSRQQQDHFISQILPVIKQIGQVAIAPAVQKSFHEADLEIKLYLDRVDEVVTAKVEFGYGEIKFNPFAGLTEVPSRGKILIRDTAKEKAMMGLLEQTGFYNSKGTLYLKEEDAAQEEAVYHFITEILPEVQKLAEVFYSDSFRKIKIRESASFSGGVRLVEDGGLLEISFALDDIDASELRDVFKSLREKKKYYRLRDGSFLMLDSPSLAQAAEMIDSLNISDKELVKETIKIPKYRALYIDRCLREANLSLERNRAFKQLVQDVTEPQDMEFGVPEQFQGVLREYQRTGYKWLKTLSMYGLGGILADDMGLGKTIQTLAFVMSEAEKLPEPSLVVAPTSVVYNWQDEAHKFAPNLQVVVVSGTRSEREALVEEGKQANLIITSYALIRRDIDLYQGFNFGYCFLDEAQHIKNPASQSAKAVKIIKARGYFALTGTPLENNLTELWSIIDFTMHGYLSSHQKFVKKYERPIVKNQDERALKDLQKHIAPFIMRRMKRDVLQELPPKIESKVLADLTSEQKKVYLTYLHQAKGEIADAIATDGFDRSQIKILSILTRLRQICCHPATFLENYQGDSGKLVYLRENLKDAVTGGRRILLFSQFTSMLQIIKGHLDQEQIGYFYLDGATKTEERGRMVQDFNRGQGEVFLISLKAGGTGLNLTGADMVIHYDPWWNPAVEEQATDRAHRIGQKNSVQVIKLITRGTIEEKIYELQQKKKDMINSVIQPGETLFSKLTEQEIKELLWGQA